jgi:hypothetical protein
MHSSVNAYAFINEKTHQQNNYLQNIIDTAIYMKPYPAVCLTDDKIGLFMAIGMSHRFRLLIEENMHVVLTLYTFLWSNLKPSKYRWAL